MIETYHYARFSVQTAIAKGNVGGAIWQAVLPLLNNFAARAGLWPHRPLQRHGTWRRCRSAVRHHARDPVEEPDLTRLHLQRICRTALCQLYAEFLREVGAGVADGIIRYREDIVDGLEKAPETFIGMLEGKNFGRS